MVFRPASFNYTNQRTQRDCYNRSRRRFQSKWTQHLCRWKEIAWVGLSTFVAVLPVQAAEQVELSYGVLEWYVPVASLETYARTGTVDSELDFYFKFIDSEAEAQIREMLQISHEISAWELSQMLYAPIGEAMLENMGTLIQTESRQNGFYALRAAMIEAADDPDGLSILGLLRHFPSEAVQIDLLQILQLSRRFSEFATLSRSAVDQIQRQADADADESEINPKSLPSLPEQGPFEFTKQTLVLQDEARDRTFPMDLYLPTFGEAIPNSIPVVVYSHGYGETRETASPYLEVLASFGFVVAVPEHIGSNHQFQQDLLKGLTDESFAASEFVDRPLDISYVLDVLEQNNASEFGDRLNLQQVGAAGHSFGGYTVMMLAGATVDFEQLRGHCQDDFLLQSLNTALLLQCRALELESSPQQVERLTSGQLRDLRIRSTIAITPVAGPILGQQSLSQIDIPVFIFGGGHDPVTPLIPEQLQAFSQLTTPDRYLLIADNVAHTASITTLVNQFLLPTDF